jgi:hypothetical protein
MRSVKHSRMALIGIVPLLAIVAACAGDGSEAPDAAFSAPVQEALPSPASTANAELCASLQSDLDTMWEESVRESLWKKRRDQMELFGCPMRKVSDARQRYADFIVPKIPAVKELADDLLKCAQQPEWNSKAKQVCAKAALGVSEETELLVALGLPETKGLPAPDPSFDCLVEQTLSLLDDLSYAQKDLMALATGNETSNLRLDVILVKPANVAMNLVATLEQWKTNSQDQNPTLIGCDYSSD